MSLIEREKTICQVLGALAQPNALPAGLFEKYRFFLLSIGAHENDSVDALLTNVRTCRQENQRGLGLLAFQAVDVNDVDILSLLKKEGVSLDVKRESGVTPLIHAI